MKLVTLDFETYYDKDYTLRKMNTIEYVTDERFKAHGVSIQINDGAPLYFTGDAMASALRAALDEPCTLICQNTKFDAFILHHHYGLYPTRYADTRSMAKALFPFESASLKELCIRLFPDDDTMRKGDELADSKGILDFDDALSQLIKGYCIQDTHLTYHCYQQMIGHFPQSEQDLIHLTTKMFVEPAIVLDRERVAAHAAISAEQRTALIEHGLTFITDQLETVYEDPKIFSSNKQFAELLTLLKVKVPSKISPTTGKPTHALGKTDLGFQKLQRDNSDYEPIWTARKAVKSTGEVTRADRLLLTADRCRGLIPAALNYYGAHTGRYSGGEKLNLQNLKRGSELRKSLCAPKDNLVYVADSSNIEARMLAWLADQRSMLDVFNAKGDVYCDFASKIYHRPIIKGVDNAERFLGKCAVLGLGYGMGADKFRDTLKMGALGPPVSLEQHEVQGIVDLYRSANSRITEYWKRCQNACAAMQNKHANFAFGPLIIEHQKIKLPNGMYLRYPDLRTEGRETVYGSGRHKTKIYGGKLCENITQALARIVVTDQMLAADDYLTSIDGRIVLQVHDELVGIAPQANPDQTINKMYDIMRTPPVWASALPLDAEGGYADNYSK